MYRSDRLYLDQCKHSWEGQGAHHNFFFLRGCARKRRRPEEMFSMEKRIRNFITTEEQEACRDSFLILGQPTRRAIHFGAPGDIKRVIWRTACKVSTSTSSCTTTKCSSDIGGVQVCRLTKRTPWDSCTTLLLSSPTLPPCTSQPESPVSSDPCTTCGRRGASKKKSVGSGFDAESTSRLGGELSWLKTSTKSQSSRIYSMAPKGTWQG